MGHENRKSDAVRSKRPKDIDAAKKLCRLMDNMGLSPEVLGTQIGASGKRIRQLVSPKLNGKTNPHYGDVPERRLRYALARRFDLLPAHIWKSDKIGLEPGEIAHMLELARRQEAEWSQGVAA